jgi:hypothetical protein
MNSGTAVMAVDSRTAAIAMNSGTVMMAVDSRTGF